MKLQPINASASPENQMNENFITLEWGAVFGEDPRTSTGLSFTFYPGRWNGVDIGANTLTLTDDDVNYIVVKIADCVASVSNADTNWKDVANYRRVYKKTAAAGVVTVTEDHRAGLYGIFDTTHPLSWNHQTDDYTLAITDAENAVAMDKSSANAVTIPADADVPFPVGTQIKIHQEGAGQTTVTPDGGVTLHANTIGSPAVYALGGQYAMATLTKRATDIWILSGDIV